MLEVVFLMIVLSFDFVASGLDITVLSGMVEHCKLLTTNYERFR